MSKPYTKKLISNWSIILCIRGKIRKSHTRWVRRPLAVKSVDGRLSTRLPRFYWVPRVIASTHTIINTGYTRQDIAIKRRTPVTPPTVLTPHDPRVPGKCRETLTDTVFVDGLCTEAAVSGRAGGRVMFGELERHCAGLIETSREENRKYECSLTYMFSARDVTNERWKQPHGNRDWGDGRSRSWATQKYFADTACCGSLKSRCTSQPQGRSEITMIYIAVSS